MLSYGLRRLLTAIPILFVILTLTFFLIHLAPGDPLSMFESPDIDPAAREQMRHGRYAPDHLYGDGRAGQRIAEKLATVNVRIQKQITY